MVVVSFLNVVVVDSSRFLLVVVLLLVVLPGGLLASTESNFGLLIHRISGSVLIVRLIISDDFEEATSGSFAVRAVVLSFFGEIIVVLLVELGVEVERLAILVVVLLVVGRLVVAVVVVVVVVLLGRLEVTVVLAELVVVTIETVFTSTNLLNLFT